MDASILRLDIDVSFKMLDKEGSLADEERLAGRCEAIWLRLNVSEMKVRLG
jgi:hypothetical protein